MNHDNDEFFQKLMSKSKSGISTSLEQVLSTLYRGLPSLWQETSEESYQDQRQVRPGKLTGHLSIVGAREHKPAMDQRQLGQDRVGKNASRQNIVPYQIRR